MNATQSRRWWPVALFSALVFFSLVYFYSLQSDASAGAQHVDSAVHTVTAIATVTATRTATKTATKTEIATRIPKSKPSYTPGNPDPDREYQKALIVASLQSENTSWVAEQLPEVEPYIYVVDDPTANLTVPRNWGNELMVYLTFIIDHYDQLPDIMIFVHAHEYTHLHNAPIFNYSTPALVRALNPHRVVREGYMNLNCGDWREGYCTAQTRPVEEHPTKFHRRAWEELFPEYPLPQVLAQSCCSQFATSRERVQQVPLAKWTHYREWLLSVPPENHNPGWVWEYLWQFVLGGEHVYCPASHVCFCDGFGACFGGEANFTDFVRLQDARETMRQNIWAVDRIEKQVRLDGGNFSEFDFQRRENMRATMQDLDVEMGRRTALAFERGKDPELVRQETDLSTWS